MTIKVIESWDLSSSGMIAELKHHLNGLQCGSIIKSQLTGNEWRIKKRILFNHTYGRQKIFTNETTTHSFLNFTSIENQIASAKNILDKEVDHTFLYQIQPIGHSSKPVKDDMLLELIIHKFACPCCGYKTYIHNPDGSYDICNVCFWEDDPMQLANPDYEGGANRVSLRQAQKNFQTFGACEKELLKNARTPSKDEVRDEDWKPLE